LLAQVFRLARPWHWIKSGFILAPVPFAVADGATLVPFTFAEGLLGFCLITSSVYAFNDIRDAEFDRRNPAKRDRPVASGALSIPAASTAAVLLLVAGLSLCLLTQIRAVTGLAGVYVLANFVYSTYAKNIPILDVFLLSSGYVIRVLLGCALVDAPPSNWLLLCSSMLALLLGFGKRRADVLAGLTEAHRKSLAGYNLGFLDQALGVCAGIALFSYALYSQDAAVFVEGRELLGLPFVAFAVFDYLRLAYTEGAGGAPVELAYRSRALQACVLGWAVATAYSLGVFP
jgi:4-hydroxybenzoate polyprenyltransferase